jgi:hypothetical protein
LRTTHFVVYVEILVAYSTGVPIGTQCREILLNDSQIDAINQHFRKCAKAYAAAGEDFGMISVKVEFEWVLGLGRFATACFDGEVEGCSIEDPSVV